MTLFSLRVRAIPSILLALCGTGAAQSQEPPADLRKTIDDARREAQQLEVRLAALPSRCTLGNAAGAAGHWLATSNAAPVPGQPYAFVFTFKEPVQSGAFRIALNPKALQKLEQVESRDAHGTWSVAWTGAQNGAPAGCEFVKLAQTFPSGGHDITALRVTVRPDKEKIVVADAAVLKAD
ncbi:hypothetical protein [Massilia putida]|uniref:hypothetical protein n=1 Tax=Massilia putida TaxID=1141883 RepID=UPI00095111A7|nr:hypothetical protein [Massilia putida]